MEALFDMVSQAQLVFELDSKHEMHEQVDGPYSLTRQGWGPRVVSLEHPPADQIPCAVASLTSADHRIQREDHRLCRLGLIV